MFPPERVVGGGQDITWEWLKFIKWVLFLSEMSFYLASGSGLGDYLEYLVPLFPPLPIFSGSLGFRDFVTGIVTIFGVLDVS